MKKTLLLAFQCLLILSTFSLFGQTSISDSLLLKSQDTELDLADRQAALYKYMHREQRNLSGEQGMEYVNVLGEMARKLDSETAQLEMLLVKGLMYTKVDSFPKAILALQSAHNVDTINYNFHGNIQRFLAGCYKVIGEFAPALEHALASERFYNKFEGVNAQSISSTKNTIGALYLELGQYDKAEEYLMESLRFAKIGAIGKKLLIAPTANLGELYQRKGSYDKAIAYYRQCLDMADTLKTTAYSPSLLSSLIDISLKQNKIGDATSLLEEMAQVVVIEDGASDIAKFHRYRGEVHLINGQFGKASSACELSRQAATSAQLLEEERDACECLYKSAKGRGDLKSAINYIEQYQAIKDTMLNQATLKQVEQLQVNHELTLLETKHSYELSQQKQVAAAAEKRQRLKLILGGIALFLLSGMLFVLYRSNQFRKSSNTQLNSLNSTLDQSNKDLELVLTGLSHDILSNLNLILTAGKALVNYDKSEQNLSLFYDTSIVAAQRTKGYCINLLKSFHDEDRLDVTTTVSINKVLQSVVKNLAPQIEEHGIELEITSYPDLTMSEGDCAQIFHNLISNAIQFVKDGTPGRISLVMKQTEENEVWLGVKDNGPGVSETEAKKIFNSGYSGRDGQGIGLWLVKEILTRYDERVWVEQNEWGGATFMFSKKINAVAPSI